MPDSAALAAAGALVVDQTEFARDPLAVTSKSSIKAQERRSCEACRKDKKKCNGGRPVCSRCKARGGICEYVHSSDSDGRASDDSTSSTFVRSSPGSSSDGKGASHWQDPAASGTGTSAAASHQHAFPGFSKSNESYITDAITNNNSTPTASASAAMTVRRRAAATREAVSLSLGEYPPLPTTPELFNVFCSEHFVEMEVSLIPSISNLRISSRSNSNAAGAVTTSRPARPPSNLLLSSILLLAPVISGVQLNAGPRVDLAARETALFPRVKDELHALLRSGRGFSVDDCAALLNLLMWAMGKGLGGLRRQFTWLVSLLSREMIRRSKAAGTIAPTHSRQAWLEYFEMQRVMIGMVHMVLRQSELVLDFDIDGDLDLSFLDVPAPPLPWVWELAQQDPNFDPALLPPSPLISEGLAFLKYPSTDPRRLFHLERARSLLMTRYVMQWQDFVLRHRVSRFLAACEQAGLESPAQLPLSVDSIDPSDETIRRLVLQRAELDTTVLQLCSIFPEEITRALSESDARFIVDYETNSGGSAVWAFNGAPIWSGIRFIRLELYTRVGRLFPAPPGRDLFVEGEKLVEEFGGGGALYVELLEEALLHTRFMENWQRLNPTLRHHTGHLTQMVRLCCLYAAFRRHLVQSVYSSNLASASAQQAVHVEHGYAVCLEHLRATSYKAQWAADVYNFVLKFGSADEITETDLKRAGLTDESREGTQFGGGVLQGFLGLYTERSQ